MLVVDAQGLLLASDGAVPGASGAVAELAAQAQADTTEVDSTTSVAQDR